MTPNVVSRVREGERRTDEHGGRNAHAGNMGKACHPCLAYIIVEVPHISSLSCNNLVSKRCKYF